MVVRHGGYQATGIGYQRTPHSDHLPDLEEVKNEVMVWGKHAGDQNGFRFLLMPDS
jgi:hypothetical protein